MNKPDRNNTRRKLTLRSQTISIIALARRLRDDQGHEEDATLSTSACCVTSTAR